MLQDVGIQNSNFNYTNMINYINGMGDLWLRLIEQFVPATTIWNGGTKFENSIFHRQKFIYRRQRECQVTSVGIPGASAGNTINPVISLITSNTPINTIEIPPGQTGNGSFVYYYFIISIPYLYNGVEYKNEYQTSSFGPYYYNNTPDSATLIGYFVDYLQTNTPFVTIKRLLNDDSGTIVNNFTTEAASGFLISHTSGTGNGNLTTTNTNTNYSPLEDDTTYSPSIIVKIEYQQQ
jgi:hypothetical protein